MELVLGTNQLTSINGAETYLVTVAEQLQTHGHGVTLYALEHGEMADFARRRGLRVESSESRLPADVEGVLTNDAVSSLDLADRYPESPHVFVCHSSDFLFTQPPQVPGTVSAVVALNERVARHLEHHALAVEVVRLRQPINARRFTRSGPIGRAPRRVLLLGNWLFGERRQMLQDAWAGLEFTQLGRHGSASSPEPELAIAEADIVVGHGRAALEGMASARAVYVFDHSGVDGWVTESSYPAMEADGFAGRATADSADAAQLTSDLAGYDPAMGVVNRDLVELNHDAASHAEELVALFRRCGGRASDGSAPLREMARLVSLQWQAFGRSEHFRTENQLLRRRLEEVEGELDWARSAVEEFQGTRRYRAAQLLAGPFEALRRRARR